MPTIELETIIHAPAARCFDLARSIDLHVVTAGASREEAIGGRTSGLIGLGETVTWKARHLGIWQRLTVRITAFDRPRHFRDEMVRGAFRSMVHDHDFAPGDDGTFMRDRFLFRSPLGPLGAIADLLVLERYMRRFLTERARILKAVAESDEWRRYTSG